MMELELPATFQMVVYGITEDGSRVAKATIDLPTGLYPREDDTDRLLAQAASSIKEYGMRLCTPREFGREIIREQTGGADVALAVAEKWAGPYEAEK